MHVCTLNPKTDFTPDVCIYMSEIASLALYQECESTLLRLRKKYMQFSRFLNRVLNENRVGGLCKQIRDVRDWLKIRPARVASQP